VEGLGGVRWWCLWGGGSGRGARSCALNKAAACWEHPRPWPCPPLPMPALEALLSLPARTPQLHPCLGASSGTPCTPRRLHPIAQSVGGTAGWSHCPGHAAEPRGLSVVPALSRGTAALRGPRPPPCGSGRAPAAQGGSRRRPC